MKSPLFDSKKNDTMKWRLYIHSQGSYISLRLELIDFDDIELLALCGFYILSVYGEKKHAKTMKIQKIKKAKTHCFCSKFLERDLLRNDDNELLPDGNLMVGCEIFYYYRTINNIGFSTNTNLNESLDVLLDDKTGMLDSPNSSDCVIRVKKIKINVHKYILAGKSEVFNSILTEKQCESNPSIITIYGFSPKVVKEMIEYLYTGKSPNMDNMACPMLKIAEKYKLKQLKLMAEKSLIHSLSIGNACDY
uniref:BTB domain-containing protein n=1 Tax=Strongyloides papillosus TaxID=174720 RepID=A0A0N5BLA5_STREA